MARATGATLLALALASACGGKSIASGDDYGDAGTGGSSSAAGTKARGGSSSSSAGSNRGGNSSSSGGSSASSGGSSSSSGGKIGGGGGPANGPCSGPAFNRSDCTAAIPRWTHESTTGLCVPFMFGGCGATANNFGSLEECQKVCPGGVPNYDECMVASDCALGANGCCGVCPSPSVTEHDYIAYGKQYAMRASRCAGNVACGACPPAGADDASKYFVPNCVRGECTVQDVRSSDATACKTSSECRLRFGSGCCEGCNEAELIAVRNDGSFEKLVCGGLVPPCAACPVPAARASAECDAATGHCVVLPLAF